MKKLKQVLVSENMLPAFLVRRKITLFLLLLLLPNASSVKLPEEWKTIIGRALEAWMKNPESFPHRVPGAYFGSLQRDHCKIPDIVIWDPPTQFQIDLACPSCKEPRTLLRAVRWKDGQTYYDQPRMLFCIQRQVILVSRVYRCSNDHQVLAHDAGILELVADNIEVPFVLFHQHGVTRDLFRYIMSHIHAGLRFTDIERLLGQLYYDTLAFDQSKSFSLSNAPQDTFINTNTKTNQRQIQHPGRRLITNCFLRCYFEQEHMYSQRMSQLPCVWLSADHTFKVSANIGAWFQGVWVKQFDSLFTVLNEKGQVLAWKLTRGTSFEKVKNIIQNLKRRLDNNGISTTSIYINNCCQWRNLLQNIFGEDVSVKLDLFHAVQRVVSKIPKRGSKGSVIKELRRRLKEDLKLVFRDPSDLGTIRAKSTPSKEILLENFEHFLTKWNRVESDGETVLTQAAKREIENLKKHINNGCLSNIPVSCGSNRNEAIHKTLKKNISRQRLGIRLAVALLGVFFYIWNEKKEAYFAQSSVIKNVQEYHQAFLKSGKPLCTEAFGVEPDVKKSNPGSEDEFDTCVIWPNDTDPCSSSDDDDTGIQNEEVIEAVKSTHLKYSVAKQLASRAKSDVHSTASSLNFMEIVLLLLSNSRYAESDDEPSSRRVDALLSGYGFQRVAMLKDGDCLFSAVAFQLQSRYASEEKDSPLCQHLRILGIEADQSDLQIITQKLRELTVKEFFGVRRSEYVSYLDCSHHDQFENMASNFSERGFFDCELGNATPLALANILQVPLVIISSIENFPVIPVIPRETPLSNVPLYIAYQRVGSGHYDATIEAQHETSLGPLVASAVLHTDSTQVKDRLQPEGDLKQITAVGCRCGRGSAKNKEARQFCHIYKDGCKCFQSVKGCTSKCACFNCGNPYGKRTIMHSVASDPVSRKRRRPTGNDVLPGSESHFMESRGIDVIAPPWSTLEELLFKECMFHVTSVDAVDITLLEKMYNSAVEKYCNSTISGASSSHLEVIPRERNSKDIEKMLS